MSFQWYGDTFFQNIRVRLQTNLGGVGDALVADLKESINTACPEFHSGSGGHSPPGSPPYRETGRLYNSVRHTGVQANEGGASLLAGSSLFYAKFLETGTSKMAARPWLGPGLRGNQSKYGQMILK